MARRFGFPFLAAAFLVSGCAFDASAPEGGGLVEDPVDPSEPENPPSEEEPNEETPEEEPAQPLSANGEDTRRGQVLQGSFAQTAVTDGEYEIIAAEVRNGDKESIDQRWFIAAVPAGDYRLEIVATGLGPRVDELFRIDVGVPGENGFDSLAPMPSTNESVAYTADIATNEDGVVSVKLRLQREVRSAEWDKGAFAPLFENVDASRMVLVDSVVLRPVN